MGYLKCPPLGKTFGKIIVLSPKVSGVLQKAFVEILKNNTTK